LDKQRLDISLIFLLKILTYYLLLNIMLEILLVVFISNKINVYLKADEIQAWIHLRQSVQCYTAWGDTERDQ